LDDCMPCSTKAQATATAANNSTLDAQTVQTVHVKVTQRTHEARLLAKLGSVLVSTHTCKRSDCGEL
jgi:hypothetical protein